MDKNQKIEQIKHFLTRIDDDEMIDDLHRQLSVAYTDWLAICSREVRRVLRDIQFEDVIDPELLPKKLSDEVLKAVRKLPLK